MPLVVVKYPKGSSFTVSRVLRAFERVLPEFEVETGETREEVDVQFCDYDAIDWDLVQARTDSLANAYAIRKALTRKHHLPQTIAQHIAKRPSSCLKQSTPTTWTFELAYADELDELWADELYELGQMLEVGHASFILKPAMADKGQGIRLFKTQEEFEGILTDFEAAEDATEEDDESTVVQLSRMRWWVVQCYIDRPLLIDSRKFHLRAYVLAIGALQVYLYTDMLALFAPKPYRSTADEIDLEAHLTNTCLQGDIPSNDSVRRFRDLPLPFKQVALVIERIGEIVGEAWQAALASGPQFQPLPNAFEIYGVDFLLDESLHPFLLEINAGPDFKQTGEELSGVIDGLFEATLRTAVAPRFGSELGEWAVTEERDGLRKCLDVAVRASW